MRDAGFEPGPVVDAERMTARGLLRWRIALIAGGVVTPMARCRS